MATVKGWVQRRAELTRKELLAAGVDPAIVEKAIARFTEGTGRNSNSYQGLTPAARVYIKQALIKGQVVMLRAEGSDTIVTTFNKGTLIRKPLDEQTFHPRKGQWTRGRKRLAQEVVTNG